MRWGRIAKRWVPRSSPELRNNDIYKWTNRFVWLLVAVFGIVAFLLARFGEK